ncbi:uncharacterized protein LOC144318323 isoform X2 [Canis aureus]
MWYFRYPGSFHPRGQPGNRNDTHHFHQTSWMGVSPVTTCGGRRSIRNTPFPVRALSNEDGTLQFPGFPSELFAFKLLDSSKPGYTEHASGMTQVNVSCDAAPRNLQIQHEALTNSKGCWLMVEAPPETTEEGFPRDHPCDQEYHIS